MDNKNDKKPVRKGGNCNVFCDIENGIAKKTLRNTRSDKKQRFKQEIEIVGRLMGSSDLRVAEVLEVYLEEKNEDSYILMRYYPYSLEDLLPQTRGNVRYSLELLLPIVKTLYKLSTNNPPIFHRDIKPENILSDGKDLYLSDFGIAYVDLGDDRFTPSTEAIGARLFMAPEFEIGRVDKIDGKGDIYSLGKVLWYMINGYKEQLMPYNLWYEKGYNLAEKYPTADGINYINLILDACLKIDPKERIGYLDLIKAIETYLSEGASLPAKEDEAKLKAQAAKREMLLSKKIVGEKAFLSTALGEVDILFERLRNSFSNDLLITSVANSLSKYGKIDFLATRGPFGSISTYSDSEVGIRLNYLDKKMGEGTYIEFEFIQRKIDGAGAREENKIRIRQSNGSLLLNYSPFDREQFYSRFISLLTKLFM